MRSTVTAEASAERGGRTDQGLRGITTGLSRTSLTIFGLTLVTGFLVVTQWQGQNTAKSMLRSQTEQDLGKIVRELTFETDLLADEVIRLKLQLADYERSKAGNQAILGEAEQSLSQLRIASGLLTVAGPGIEVKISDRKDILETPDLLELIQELKVAGAEAISVNGHRLTANTYFKKQRGKLYVNGERSRAGYNVKAIGDTELLFQSITLAGGMEDRLASLKGVAFSIVKKPELVLPPADD